MKAIKVNKFNFIFPSANLFNRIVLDIRIIHTNAQIDKSRLIIRLYQRRTDSLSQKSPCQPKNTEHWHIDGSDTLNSTHVKLLPGAISAQSAVVLQVKKLNGVESEVKDRAKGESEARRDN